MTSGISCISQEWLYTIACVAFKRKTLFHKLGHKSIAGASKSDHCRKNKYYTWKIFDCCAAARQSVTSHNTSHPSLVRLGVVVNLVLSTVC